jgi:hypothetical protein
MLQQVELRYRMPTRFYLTVSSVVHFLRNLILWNISQLQSVIHRIVDLFLTIILNPSTQTRPSLNFSIFVAEWTSLMPTASWCHITSSSSTKMGLCHQVMDDSTDVVSYSTEQITNCSPGCLFHLSCQFQDNAYVINTLENQLIFKYLKHLTR